MRKKQHYESDFLFPRTNFLIGIGSILNLSGNYYEFNSVRSEQEADCKALESDWGVIGLDLLRAHSANILKLNR